MTKRIRVTVDGVVYHAVLLRNALAEKIAGMCPFALDCTRSGEHEYYAALPGKAVAALNLGLSRHILKII